MASVLKMLVIAPGGHLAPAGAKLSSVAALLLGSYFQIEMAIESSGARLTAASRLRPVVSGRAWHRLAT